MKMNKIYGLCAVQLMGVGVQLMNRVAGSMIVFQRKRSRVACKRNDKAIELSGYRSDKLYVS